jgi:hypothetical protein
MSEDRTGSRFCADGHGGGKLALSRGLGGQGVAEIDRRVGAERALVVFEVAFFTRKPRVVRLDNRGS